MTSPEEDLATALQNVMKITGSKSMAELHAALMSESGTIDSNTRDRMLSMWPLCQSTMKKRGVL